MIQIEMDGNKAIDILRTKNKRGMCNVCLSIGKIREIEDEEKRKTQIAECFGCISKNRDYFTASHYLEENKRNYAL